MAASRILGYLRLFSIVFPIWPTYILFSSFMCTTPLLLKSLEFCVATFIFNVLTTASVSDIVILRINVERSSTLNPGIGIVAGADIGAGGTQKLVGGSLVEVGL